MAIGTLTVDLVAQTASFNANITKAAANLNSQTARMNRSLDLVQGKLTSFATGAKVLAGSFAVTQLAAVATRALDYASSLGEVSQQLGVTTKDLQVYRYAATQAGISQEEMDKGLAKLTQSLGKAQLGAQQQGKVFDALGISLRTASGGYKTTSDILPEIADALSKIPDPAKRAAVEVELFGRAGQKLDTLLAGGSGAIDELSQAAQKLGIVLSDEQIQKADETADKLASIKTVLEARIAGVVADNANAILQLANSFAVAAEKAIEYGTAINDVLAGANKVKSDKGYLSFLFTDVGDMRQIGARERRASTLGSRMDSFLARDTPSRTKPAGGVDIEGMLAPRGRKGGGGGGKSAAEKAAEEAKKLTAEFEKQLAATKDQIRWDKMRADGLGDQVDVQEAIKRITEQFPTLDEARLKILKDQVTAQVAQEHSIRDQKKGIEAAAEAAKKAGDAMKRMQEQAADAQAKQMEKIADLQDRINAKQQDFADDIGESFGNALQDALEGRPLDGLKNLVNDLAKTFQKEFIVDPFKRMISDKVGMPLAKNLGVGGFLAKDGIPGMEGFTFSLKQGELAVNGFAGSMGKGGMLSSFDPSMFGSDMAGMGGLDLSGVNDNLDLLTTNSAKAADALGQQTGKLGQFGSGLLNLLSMSAGSSAGGGGFLSTALGFASSLIGSGAIKFGGGGAVASIGKGAGSVGKALKGLKIPKFADGTNFAPGGLSLVGENGPEFVTLPRGAGVIPSPASRAMLPLMRANDNRRGGDTFHISVGPGGTERERRETANMTATAVKRAIGQSSRLGY